MYNDTKTARDRVKSKKYFSWTDGNLTKGQTIALIIVCVLFLIGAMHADYQALLLGIS